MHSPKDDPGVAGDALTDHDLEELGFLMRAKDHHRLLLLSKPNVTGLDIGYRETDEDPERQKTIKVYVSRKLPSSMLDEEDLVPSTLEFEGRTAPVDVEEKPMDRLHDA